jgi:hypothetical protein
MRVDHLYDALDGELSNALLDNGFVNLGWAGRIRLRLHNTRSLRRRHEEREDVDGRGDPIAAAAFKIFDISSTSVIDVLTSCRPA